MTGCIPANYGNIDATEPNMQVSSNNDISFQLDNICVENIAHQMVTFHWKNRKVFISSETLKFLIYKLFGHDYILVYTIQGIIELGIFTTPSHWG